jgi:hypothetical protein
MNRSVLERVIGVWAEDDGEVVDEVGRELIVVVGGRLQARAMPGCDRKHVTRSVTHLGSRCRISFTFNVQIFPVERKRRSSLEAVVMDAISDRSFFSVPCSTARAGWDVLRAALRTGLTPIATKHSAQLNSPLLSPFLIYSLYNLPLYHLLIHPPISLSPQLL